MPLINGDFENWVAGAPVGWTLGFNDVGSWSEETGIYVYHGLSSLKLNACCYAALTYGRQIVDATPWRGINIKVKAWGRCYAFSNNDLNVVVDGTGGWNKHATISDNYNWQERGITGLVPNDATTITIYVRINSGGIREVSGWWDWVAMSPVVTTDPATLVGAGAATLNGTLDQDGGEACDCGFEWGETIVYGNTTPTQSRTTGQTFAQALAGLDPNKTYHFRAFATNSTETSYGADRTFVTSAALPTVITDPATDSILNGTLGDDGGMACDCGFESGETIAYEHGATPTQSRTTGQTFSQILGGLVPGTTYHYRAFATNGAGTSYGADRTFATPAGIPTVTTNPATGIGMILAVLNGTLDADGGEICECGFEWGADTSYGLTTPTESKITAETFSQLIRGLFPGRVYHFRAFATNSHGTGYGDDESFYSKPSVSIAYALAREEL